MERSLTTPGITLAAPGETGVPLAQIAMRNAGLRRGVRAMTVLASWMIVQAAVGHELGAAEGGHLTAAVREYTEWWKQSERTTWRDVQAFREAFPGEESPARLAGALQQHHELVRDARRRKLDAAAVAGVLVAA